MYSEPLPAPTGAALQVQPLALFVKHLPHILTRLASDIKAGTVWINCHFMFDAGLSIGGYKESGWSRDSGQQAI